MRWERWQTDFTASVHQTVWVKELIDSLIVMHVAWYLHGLSLCNVRWLSFF